MRRRFWESGVFFQREQLEAEEKAGANGVVDNCLADGQNINLLLHVDTQLVKPNAVFMYLSETVLCKTVRFFIWMKMVKFYTCVGLLFYLFHFHVACTTTGEPRFAECKILCRVHYFEHSATLCRVSGTRQRKTLGKQNICRVFFLDTRQRCLFAECFSLALGKIYLFFFFFALKLFLL
jgi:hypothetical protein